MFPNTVSYCVFLIILTNMVPFTETEVFTINTKGCTIRGFPLVSESIRNLIQPLRITHKCPENRLLDSNSSHIWVIQDALDLFNVINEQEFYCCYRQFQSENYIENIKYGACVQFSTYTKAKHKFVRIECYYYENKMYDDFFVFTNTEKVMPKDNDDRHNVLILGIESMSRMNFHRTMAKTSEYLRQRGSIELLGYNKVGDNSLPNIFPLIFGHSFKRIKETCFRDGAFEYDHCDFVWDTFKEAGYYTALGSDSMAGFLGDYEYYNLTRPPTDFYLQPFMFETRHLFRNKQYSYHQCLGSKYMYKIFLNYIEGLSNALKYNRLFGIFWSESISHEHLNLPHIMDEDYLRLLIKLEENSYLNETVLIFLSDHGMRWGDIVYTDQGRLEARLPLLQVLFPDSFKWRYKQAFENFQQNSHRLTTPYDINETLRDLLHPVVLEDYMIKTRSSLHSNKSSLFLPVPDSRTCESVGIEEHWCTCYKGRKLKSKNNITTLAANFLISHINHLLSPYSQCRKLKVNKILQVNMVRSGDGRIYTAVVETSPGGAVLDGTLYREREAWTVSGTVSRLNLYRNQTCISDDFVKMYCFCN